MKWSHVGLNCNDIDVTIRFYTGLFGFEVARTVPLGDDRIVFLRNGDAYLELFSAAAAGLPAEQDGPRQTGTVRHLAFATDDVDAFLAGPGAGLPVLLGPLRFDTSSPAGAACGCPTRTVWWSR